MFKAGNAKSFCLLFMVHKPQAFEQRDDYVGSAFLNKAGILQAFIAWIPSLISVQKKVVSICSLKTQLINELITQVNWW